ncbi:hypothetical protein QL285_050062 [Trifolium repens]|nr:hypothetical protein QL285_050062 [Trifolium repens]
MGFSWCLNPLGSFTRASGVGCFNNDGCFIFVVCFVVVFRFYSNFVLFGGCRSFSSINPRSSLVSCSPSFLWVELISGGSDLFLLGGWRCCVCSFSFTPALVGSESLLGIWCWLCYADSN